MIRVRKVRNLEASLETLRQLDAECFPGDLPYNFRKEDHHWWIAYDGEDPIGFAGSWHYRPDNGVFLCRAGTLPKARGKGVQKALIDVRVAHAKRLGVRWCYTYTLADNYISSNNLIKRGFLLFRPGYAWVGTEGVLYWAKKFRT